MALTLAQQAASGLWSESQAPEGAQPEVLELASLGTGALLLLGPRPFCEMWVVCRGDWCVLGPSSLVCGGEQKGVAVGPSAREETVPCWWDEPHPGLQSLSLPVCHVDSAPASHPPHPTCTPPSNSP